MPSEKATIKAINHIISTMDRRGCEKLTEERKRAYDVLWALREGLDGNPEDGTMIVFYTP